MCLLSAEEVEFSMDSDDDSVLDTHSVSFNATATKDTLTPAPGLLTVWCVGVGVVGFLALFVNLIFFPPLC